MNNRSDFASQVRYYVPKSVMEETRQFLLTQGELNREAFVLWIGTCESQGNYQVSGIDIPRQTASQSAYGYSFDIPQDSIRELQQRLTSLSVMGLIQVHSHPGVSTRHSTRDDELGLLGRLGALSIVLPHFGNIRFTDFSETSVHILTGINRWERLSERDVSEMLTII